MLNKIIFGGLIFSLAVLVGCFTPLSFAFGYYDSLSEWGKFGIYTPGSFSYPEFIAVDSDGNSYVTDLGNKRIQVFSSTGEYVTHWGQSGKLPGEFHYPSGIAIHDNFVYVADHDLHKIQKFNLDGTFVDQWGSKGTHDGQFKYPNGVAATDGFIYVVDTGNQRIQKFTSDGEFILSFGSSGMGKGQFLTIVGIDVDLEGNLYVTDKGNRKIEKFDSEGSLIKSLSFHGLNYIFAPKGIEIDPNGGIFVVNSSNNKILYLEQNDDLTLNAFDMLGPFRHTFVMPTDIAFGVNGELLIVDSAAHKVHTFETPFYVEPPKVVEIIIPEIIIPETIRNEFAQDITDPNIRSPFDLVLDATGLYTLVSIGDAVAADVDSGIKAIINNAPEKFPLGVNKVTWIAFDNAGNTSEAYQIVTINVCGRSPSEYNLIMGTAQTDFIQGTIADDLIFGLGGDDIISGNDGNDCIFAGNGDDIVYGNDGDDTIFADSGDDIVKGQSGIDTIHGNLGLDIINGGTHHDVCYDFDDSDADVIINCES